MKVAVLGGGHGCYAAAADLSEQGHEVRLWRRDTAQLQPLLDRPVMTLKDEAGERDIPIAKVCADIGEAIAGADLVLIPSPAIAQTDIARVMAPPPPDRRPGRIPATGHLWLLHHERDRAWHRQQGRCQLGGNRHPALAGPQAWRYRHQHHHSRHPPAYRRVPRAQYRPRPGGDWQSVPQRGALRRCPVRRPDECRPHHPPTADHDERRPAGTLPGLGYS